VAELLRFSEHLIHDGFTYAYALAAADLTGGESPDLVVTDINVGIHLFENDGRGGFTHHLVHRRGCEWLERHVVADIDGDGKPEIVSVDNINGCLVCFEYDGDPREAGSRGRTTLPSATWMGMARSRSPPPDGASAISSAASSDGEGFGNGSSSTRTCRKRAPFVSPT